MRVPLIGMAVVTALIGGYAVFLRLTPHQRSNLESILFVAAFLVILGGSSLLRQMRSQSWVSASAKIETCSRTYSPQGTGQEYICSYLYEVDGTRQGGTLNVFGTNANLEQITAALVGRSIKIIYNPDDCTQSVIDADSINGWRVQ